MGRNERNMPPRRGNQRKQNYGKKGSGNAGGAMMVLAVAMLGIPALAILGVVGFLLHGHGVI